MQPHFKLLICVAAVTTVAAWIAEPNSRSAAGSRVTIDANGVSVIDGRRVFPIGFTMPPPPDGKTPEGRGALDELRAAGATMLRTGPMAEPWTEQIIAREKQYLYAAARLGMHCLINLRELSSIKPGEDAKEAKLRRIVTLFRDHAGLGFWKGVDEPEWGKHPIPPMLRAREIIKELDPYHPIEITQAPRGTVDTLRPYNAACDIVAADIYPVGYPPGAHSVEPNKEISMVGDFTRRMMDVAEGKMPVWITLQIAWSGVIKEGKTLRFPTFAEQRFMTYQAIINGARGLIYFGGHIPKAMADEDKPLGWNWRFWNRVLRPVIAEIGDKSPLYPALIAPNSQIPIKASPNEGVEVLVRETEEAVFVLACKREGKTVKVEFSGLPAVAESAEVMYEPPRSVAVKSGKFTDWFGPFEVHIYRFKKAG